MLDDDYRRSSDLPVAGHSPIPAQRSSSGVVAPVTLGRPRWRRRHAHVALALDAGAAGCIPVLHLLWRGVAPLPLVMAVLSAIAVSIVGRGALRAWLRHLRRHGRAMSRMLAVGTETELATLVERTRRSPSLGWRIDGACTPTGTGPNGALTIASVPVLGDLDSVAALALAQRFDAVAVCPTPGWTPIRLQQLARSLDCSRSALLVDPRFMTCLGPCASATQVKGVPLLRLRYPGLHGVRRLLKETTDRTVALLILVLLAPLLLGCALAVRWDGGPALRREVRIGEGGRTISLLMFRTAAVDTEAVTAVGRVLRRWWLDEIPQLLNVLSGSMALVGPRPPLPSEVIHAARHEYRRLPVKPGMTGLWQIADNDELSWERAAALNLQYVATWTPLLDARILLRTIGVALRAGAAR